MDEIAQIMAAKLEQQARLMPPDIDQTLGSDADSSLDWQNADLSLEEDEEASASSPPAPQQVKPGSRRALKRGDKPRTKEIPFQDLPKVAIVGRPNVGKSALFNRITGSATAIVYDYPGVTRDRLYTRAYWGNTEFVVVDTGGLMGDASKLDADISAAAMHAISAEGLPEAIERQAAAGVAEADCIVLVMDGQTGLTATDQEIVSWLRRSHPKKPVMLAINKCENPQKADIQAADFWALGLEPIALSAISGSGTGELMEQLVHSLPPPKSEEHVPEGAEPLAVAIVGRPNVGKSSLLNSFVGRERSIVSSMSGTTRDAIDTDLVLPDGRAFTLIDTAGIRKRVAVSASKDGAEPLSVGRALAAIRRADLAVLVIDAVECTTSGHFAVTTQDFRLCEIIAAEGRACVIVVNKWDCIKDKSNKTMEEYRTDVLASMRPITWATVVFTSATTGQRVSKVLDAATEAGKEHGRRVSTATMNMVLQETLAWKSPPTGKGSQAKRGRIYYVTQAATRPPTFVFFVNDPKLFTDDYRRYVERQLRDNVGFAGTPVRMFWRGKAATSPLGT